MVNRKSRIPRRRGIGLVEMLISLTITAALLTATAVAVDTSFRAYQVNQEQSSLNQAARVAMTRMLATIRGTSAHVPYDSYMRTYFQMGYMMSGRGISMMDDDSNQVDFYHDWETQRLIAVHDGTEYTLLDGVTAFSVNLEPMRSAQAVKTGGSFDLLRRATITMTIQTSATSATSTESNGSQTMTISGSAMPRRNDW
jgi:hypothetical protein